MQHVAEPKKYNRQDYLNGKCSHQDYYAQIVNSIGLDKLIPFFPRPKEELHDSYNLDWHLNNIALREWDRSAIALQKPMQRAFKDYGDFWSLGGHVCVLKEAVRMFLFPSNI